MSIKPESRTIVLIPFSTVPITSVPLMEITALPAVTFIFLGVFFAMLPEIKRKTPFLIFALMDPD